MMIIRVFRMIIIAKTVYMRSVIYLMVLLAFATTMFSCKDETPWAQYTSKEAGFSVFMPAGPKKSDHKNGKLTMHSVTWKPETFALDKFKLFEVSYTDYPSFVASDSNKVNALLDTAISYRKRDFTELDVDHQPITINGYPGRAFMLQPDRGNTITIVKQCLVGNRVYELCVIAKKDYPVNNELNRFFNSFQVLR